MDFPLISPVVYGQKTSAQETYSAYPRGMGAPLPGGMPLVKSFASQAQKETTQTYLEKPGFICLTYLDVFSRCWYWNYTIYSNLFNLFNFRLF